MLCQIASHAITPAPLPGVTDDVIQVAQGCGRGWVRNRWGRCVRVGGPVVIGRPVAVCRTVWNGYRRVRVCR